MFNKKELEEQQKQINELQKEVESLQFTNSDLKESFDKILDTLEGDNFSKEWEEYQKYREMKNKLPDIEEMYQLKRFKELIHANKISEKQIQTYRLLIAQISTSFHSTILGSSSYNAKEATIILLNDEININNKIINKIEEVLEYIKTKSKQKDFIEVFKLYGISTEWLKP